MLVILFIDEVAVASLIVIDLDVQAMDRALVLRNVILCGHNARLTFVALHTAHSQLIIHGRCAVHKCGTLALKDLYPRLLSEAFLLPLGEGAVVLINGGLLA